MNRIGNGFVRHTRKGKRYYSGSLPFDPNTPVCILSKTDLDALVENAMIIVAMHRTDMEQRIFTLFPDNITWKSDGVDTKLYLDRHFYAFCFKDCIFVRYQSVDEAFFEGELR